MTDDLKKKVEQWLAAEGFPIEFFVAETLNSSGFIVRQGSHARDHEDSRAPPREIDVLAHIDVHRDRVLARCELVVESKYTGEAPWVIFTSPHGRMASRAVCAQTVTNELGDAALALIRDADSPSLASIFYSPDRPGLGGVQALKKNNPDRVYGTLQAVVEKTFLLSRAPRPRDAKARRRLLIEHPYALIIFPLVVVDGPLYEAHWHEEDRQVVVAKVENIRIHWRGAAAWPLHATIDIVTKDSLVAFAKRRARELTALADALADAAELISKCLAESSLASLELAASSSFLHHPPQLVRHLVSTSTKSRRRRTSGRSGSP